MHHFKDGFPYRRFIASGLARSQIYRSGLMAVVSVLPYTYLFDLVSVEMIKPRRVVQGRGMAAV